MNVYTQNNKVVKVEGMLEHPDSRGTLCEKGLAAKEILYTPDRLKHPLKRLGKRGEGRWKTITWDEALETIALRLKEIKETYGPEAVDLHWGHDHAHEQSRYLKRLANLFGTPNTSSPFYICMIPRKIAMKYTFGEVAAPNVSNTKCAILWGSNHTNTCLPQEERILEAKRKGAVLIVVDPRLTQLAGESDLHAQIRPGTDGALALGLLNVIITNKLFDDGFVEKWTIGFRELWEIVNEYPPEITEKITGVPAGTIRNMAKTYAKTKPACITMGNALDQTTNAFQASRAIAILMAVTGNLDVPGGNVFAPPTFIYTAPVSLDEKLPIEQKKKRIGSDKYLLCREYKRAHTPSLWDAILTGNPYPIKAVFIMAANPAVVFAKTNIVKEALKKLDFLAVADIFMTETAKLADVVLPACTFLEKTYYKRYEFLPNADPVVPQFISIRPKVVEPLGESWSDLKIIFELAKKMGYDEYFPWKNVEEAIDFELKPMGITFEAIKKTPSGILFLGPPLIYKKYIKTGFQTPSKKVEIYSKQLETLGFNPLPVYEEPKESPLSQPELARKFPLTLTAGAKLPMYTHSQMRNIPRLQRLMSENLVEINPKTAGKLKIKDGVMVIVESPRGSVKCSASLTDGIAEHVVCMYHGFAGANPNELLDYKTRDPVTGSTSKRASLCRVKIYK